MHDTDWQHMEVSELVTETTNCSTQLKSFSGLLIRAGFCHITTCLTQPVGNSLLAPLTH